jgi:hypothetical protein
VRLTVRSPSRTIRRFVVSGDVTCDNSDLSPFGGTTKSRRFSFAVRSGESHLLPDARLSLASCSWSLTVVGQPVRTGVTHRMTVVISVSSPKKCDAVISRLGSGGVGDTYDRQECTVFEGRASTSRRCRSLLC